MRGIVRTVVYILIIAVVFGLLFWLIDASPIPEPFRGYIHWGLIVVAVLVLIDFLLSLVDSGSGYIKWPKSGE